MAQFRDVLAKRLGWTFDDKDIGRLDRVLGERAEHHGMDRGDYLNRLDARAWEAETTELARRLTITETYFFRHGEQFQALKEIALPEVIRRNADRRAIRMLSVACSSGEEAYSLAIAAKLACPGHGWSVSVTGLDANPEMLRKAAAGVYSDWSMRETPEAVRRQWFDKDPDGWRVRDEARAMVQFVHANVADGDAVLWAPERYDVVFCRNLLMYLTPDTAAALVRRMTGALCRGGYLFLGHTDSLGHRPAGLEARHSNHTFYYRRPMEDDAPPKPAISEPKNHEKADNDALNRAFLLLTEERFAEALETLTRDVPDNPEPRRRLLHGMLLAQAGRIREARDLAEALTGQDSLYADGHQLLGLCCEGHGDPIEAMAQYRMAAYLDPDFALARMRLGQLSLRHGEHRAAAAELERALHLLPGEHDERITLFGGGFGRIALTVLCRSEFEACGAKR